MRKTINRYPIKIKGIGGLNGAKGQFKLGIDKEQSTNLFHLSRIEQNLFLENFDISKDEEIDLFIDELGENNDNYIPRPDMSIKFIFNKLDGDVIPFTNDATLLLDSINPIIPDFEHINQLVSDSAYEFIENKFKLRYYTFNGDIWRNITGEDVVCSFRFSTVESAASFYVQGTEYRISNPGGGSVDIDIVMPNREITIDFTAVFDSIPTSSTPNRKFNILFLGPKPNQNDVDFNIIEYDVSGDPNNDDPANLNSNLELSIIDYNRIIIKNSDNVFEYVEPDLGTVTQTAIPVSLYNSKNGNLITQEDINSTQPPVIDFTFNVEQVNQKYPNVEVIDSILYEMQYNEEDDRYDSEFYIRIEGDGQSTGDYPVEVLLQPNSTNPFFDNYQYIFNIVDYDFIRVEFETFDENLTYTLEEDNNIPFTLKLTKPGGGAFIMPNNRRFDVRFNFSRTHDDFYSKENMSVITDGTTVNLLGQIGSSSPVRLQSDLYNADLKYDLVLNLLNDSPNNQTLIYVTPNRSLSFNIKDLIVNGPERVRVGPETLSVDIIDKHQLFLQPRDLTFNLTSQPTFKVRMKLKDALNPILYKTKSSFYSQGDQFVLTNGSNEPKMILLDDGNAHFLLDNFIVSSDITPPFEIDDDRVTEIGDYFMYEDGDNFYIYYLDDIVFHIDFTNDAVYTLNELVILAGDNNFEGYYDDTLIFSNIRNLNQFNIGQNGKNLVIRNDTTPIFAFTSDGSFVAGKDITIKSELIANEKDTSTSQELLDYNLNINYNLIKDGMVIDEEVPFRFLPDEVNFPDIRTKFEPVGGWDTDYSIPATSTFENFDFVVLDLSDDFKEYKFGIDYTDNKYYINKFFSEDEKIIVSYKNIALQYIDLSQEYFFSEGEGTSEFFFKLINIDNSSDTDPADVESDVTFDIVQTGGFDIASIPDQTLVIPAGTNLSEPAQIQIIDNFIDETVDLKEVTFDIINVSGKPSVDRDNGKYVGLIISIIDDEITVTSEDLNKDSFNVGGGNIGTAISDDGGIFIFNDSQGVHVFTNLNETGSNKRIGLIPESFSSSTTNKIFSDILISDDGLTFASTGWYEGTGGSSIVLGKLNQVTSVDFTLDKVRLPELPLLGNNSTLIGNAISLTRDGKRFKYTNAQYGTDTSVDTFIEVPQNKTEYNLTPSVNGAHRLRSKYLIFNRDTDLEEDDFFSINTEVENGTSYLTKHIAKYYTGLNQSQNGIYSVMLSYSDGEELEGSRANNPTNLSNFAIKFYKNGLLLDKIVLKDDYDPINHTKNVFNNSNGVATSENATYFVCATHESTFNGKEDTRKPIFVRRLIDDTIQEVDVLVDPNKLPVYYDLENNTTQVLSANQFNLSILWNRISALNSGSHSFINDTGDRAITYTYNGQSRMLNKICAIVCYWERSGTIWNLKQVIKSREITSEEKNNGFYRDLSVSRDFNRFVVGTMDSISVWYFDGTIYNKQELEIPLKHDGVIYESVKTKLSGLGNIFSYSINDPGVYVDYNLGYLDISKYYNPYKMIDSLNGPIISNAHGSNNMTSIELSNYFNTDEFNEIIARRAKFDLIKNYAQGFRITAITKGPDDNYYIGWTKINYGVRGSYIGVYDSNFNFIKRNYIAQGLDVTGNVSAYPTIDGIQFINGFVYVWYGRRKQLFIYNQTDLFNSEDETTLNDNYVNILENESFASTSMHVFETGGLYYFLAKDDTKSTINVYRVPSVWNGVMDINLYSKVLIKGNTSATFPNSISDFHINNNIFVYDTIDKQIREYSLPGVINKQTILLDTIDVDISNFGIDEDDYLTEEQYSILKSDDGFTYISIPYLNKVIKI